MNGSFAKVSRACTDVVYASSPFGGTVPVDRFSLDFVIPEGATSFVLSAFHDGSTTTLSSLEAPSGRSHDLLLGTLGEFHPAARANLDGFPVDVDRIMVPPSPNHREMFETGRWEARGDTTGSKFCLTLAVADRQGTSLDLTVYFIGVEGLTAANAARHGSLQRVFDRVDEVFNEVGLGLDRDDVRYVDMNDMESSVRFSVLRSFDSFQELLRTSSTASSSADDALRLNVFLIRGFGGNLPTGLLGVASGAPGAAGVHGTSDSGIVFGVEDFLGVFVEATDDTAAFDGDVFLGDVMAHEIGHFLGLFHTTEVQGGNDPLDDTPACSLATVTTYEGLWDCPDVNNLMFPLAVAGSGAELSAGQVEMMLFNPLLR